jgi:hypothetical protein
MIQLGDTVLEALSGEQELWWLHRSWWIVALHDDFVIARYGSTYTRFDRCSLVQSEFAGAWEVETLEEPDEPWWREHPEQVRPEDREPGFDYPRED